MGEVLEPQQPWMSELNIVGDSVTSNRCERMRRPSRVRIGFVLDCLGLSVCLSGWRVPGIPVPHSLLDPLHHRPAVRLAGCIAALTTSILPAL
jgi:hypothetical protein